MKHFIKVLFVLMLFILAACSSNDSDAEESFIGKWRVIDKGANDCPDTIHLYDDEDHTYTMTYADEGNLTGTYKDLGDDNNYKLDIDGEDQVFKFVRDGDTLTVSDGNGKDACDYEVDSGDDENEDNNSDENNENNNEDDDNTNDESIFNDDENNNNENDHAGTDENEDTNQAYEQYRSKVDPVDDEGDPEIWFEGEATYENDEIIIYGQTNLLPGSELLVSPDGEDSNIMGGWENAVVQEDGTFYAENDIPSGFDDTLIQEITFTPDDQEDDIKSHYQPEEDKLDGPFAYLDVDDDDMMKTIEVELEFEEGKSHSKAKIEEPRWDKPDDYGSTEVWIEADIEEDVYVYVSGTSNLLEGTTVAATYEMPDKIQIGYNDFPVVNPDGSFEAKIKNPDDKENVDEHTVNLSVSPSNNEWPNVTEAYGEEGEEFEGDLVEKESDGMKKVFKKVDVN